MIAVEVDPNVFGWVALLWVATLIVTVVLLRSKRVTRWATRAQIPDEETALRSYAMREHPSSFDVAEVRRRFDEITRDLNREKS